MPKASEAALRFNEESSGFNLRTALFDDPFAFTVTVAVWLELTLATLTVNGALVPPAAMDTLAGTLTALLLLVTRSVMPPVGAAALRDIVHAVEPAPVNVVLPQERPLTAGPLAPGAFNNTAMLLVEPFALAVNVAVCVLLTEATVALNEAVMAPGFTDKLAWTVTAPLLLATATLRPFEGAAEVRETVHDVVPAPVKELAPQASVLIVGATVGVSGAMSESETDRTVLPWVAVIVAV